MVDIAVNYRAFAFGDAQPEPTQGVVYFQSTPTDKQDQRQAELRLVMPL
jgi:hypothetical protein